MYQTSQAEKLWPSERTAGTYISWPESAVTFPQLAQVKYISAAQMTTNAEEVM